MIKLKVNNYMYFEVGKYYQHISGLVAYICGLVKTELWGETLIAEVNSDSPCCFEDTKLIPFAKPFDKINNEEWKEITREEFMDISYEDWRNI